MATLVDHLRQEGSCRLLVLTGPGGVGKTRLALHVATEVAGDFDHGVAFIPLAAMRDPVLVPATIAKAIGMQETGAKTLIQQLEAFLTDKHMLLILDNFEQLVQAGPDVGEILASCPRLTALVTSRARLRLSGERDVPVAPLPVPSGATRSVRELADVESVRLYVDRARSIDPDFSLTDDNGGAVAEICQRLEGLPLAIELAASRIAVLPPTALVSHLERRLPILTGGPRDLPARLQTMRDAIAWSYDLLAPVEQALFRNLSVFAGGFTLAAAERVADRWSMDRRPEVDDSPASFTSTGAPHPLPHTLDMIGALVDASLLRQTGAIAGEPRYEMLETLREYGQEQLQAHEELEEVRDRHAAHLLAFAEATEPKLRGHNQVTHLARLEAEHDNLRAALDWLLNRDRANDALRLGSALAQFWLRRGHLAEGRARLEAILGLPGAAVPTTSRAQTLTNVALLAEAQSDFSGVQAIGETALALWREIGDPLGTARILLRLAANAKPVEREAALAAECLALFRTAGEPAETAMALADLAGIARDRGDLKQARSLLDESVPLYRQSGDTVGIAWPLAGLGLITWYEGDDRRARDLFDQSRSLFRAAADRRGVTWTTHGLGLVAWTQAELENAAAFHEEALALAQETGDRREVSLVRAGLGYVAESRGDAARARQHFATAFAINRDLSNAWGVALCLDGLAGLELARNPARSVSLMAATAAWREREHNPLPPRYQPRRDRILEEARAQLGPATFAAAWSIGSTTPLDDLAAEVSTLLPSLRWQEAIADEQVRGTEPVMAIAATSRNAVDRLVEALNSTRMLSPTGNALGLTYRELEVLQLLTRRATDREIANALSISPRTAMHHVSNILTKLGVTNRRDAAEVAVRLDIG